MVAQPWRARSEVAGALARRPRLAKPFSGVAQTCKVQISSCKAQISFSSPKSPSRHPNLLRLLFRWLLFRRVLFTTGVYEVFRENLRCFLHLLIYLLHCFRCLPPSRLNLHQFFSWNSPRELVYLLKLGNCFCQLCLWLSQGLI